MAAVSASFSKWAVVDNRPADLSFLAPKLKKRLTASVSMALEVAHSCVGDKYPHIRSVFCTRYGEYDRTFKMLNTLLNASFISPAAFSLSTLNVPSGILAMNTGNKASSTTVSSLSSTLENGFLEAAMIMQQYDEPILFVYVDVPIPEAYGAKFCGTEAPIAMGILLAPNGNQVIQLSWEGSSELSPPPKGLPSSVRKLNETLTQLNADGFSFDDGRLTWSWGVRDVCTA